MDTATQGVLPQHKSLVYMPFPFTQRMKAPLPCDGELLVFELAGNMFSSWANSFSQCVQIKEHLTNLALFTALIQHCINIGTSFILETVVDQVEFWDINHGELSHRIQPNSYRIWIPLTPHGALSFCQDCAITYPDDNTSKPARKKARTTEEAAAFVQIRSKTQLMAALRLYFGARKPIHDVLFNTVDDMNMEDTQTFDRGDMHILTLLSADTYFKNAHVVEKHRHQRLHPAQSNLSRYLHSGPEDQALLSFYPDDILRQSGLCRLLITGPGSIIRSAEDIFGYLLPHYIPPRRLVLDKIRTVLDSVGETLDPRYSTASLDTILQLSVSATGGALHELFADPITYSPIEVFTGDSVLRHNTDGFQSSDEMHLKEVYPICTHLKYTNLDRIHGAATVSEEEVRRVYANLVHETSTLLASQIQGVPSVYYELMNDTNTVLTAFADLKLQAPSKSNRILLTTSKMFYQTTTQKEAAGYTGLGTRLLRTIVGAINCLRLLEQQVSLFLLLYCRHFTTTSNKTGIGGGFFIICGPPDTGKSRACEQWLGCCAQALHRENDGTSSKSYTANNTAQDLRCVYEDEIKDLLNGGGDHSDAGSSNSVKARQTIISRGFVRYSRLIQNPKNGKFENDDILIMNRTMLVGCTNALNAIPPAIQSRASIVPVVKDIRQDVEQLSVNTLVASRANQGVQLWEKSFMGCMQLISGLQGRFHALEAFGAIPGGINDNLFVLFQLLYEQEHGINTIPPRRCLDIKETAQGILVLDLVTLWYSRGFGAKYNFCPITEAKFYATRAVLRMEHIVAAMWMLTSSTSLQGHLLSVSQVLKGMIRWEGNYPVCTQDGDYFILNSTHRTLFADISHQLSNLGAGLVKQVLSEIQRGITVGLPNMKTETNTLNQELLLINCAFIAEILLPVETIILAILREYIQQNLQAHMSYDETYYVFDTAIRRGLYNNKESGAPVHAKLRGYTSTQIARALGMLSRREVVNTGVNISTAVKQLAWETPSEYPICVYVEAGTPGCVPVKSHPEKYKIETRLVSPLVVHRSMLDVMPGCAASARDATCLTALCVAGGYKPLSRILLGPAPMSDAHSIDHYITIPPLQEASITVKNPFYTPQGNLGMNLLFDAPDPHIDPTNFVNETLVPDDCMFPRAQEHVTFTQHSQLEDRLVQARYRSMYNNECPPEFLPSFTNYI
jgi:hypothetical protein